MSSMSIDQILSVSTPRSSSAKLIDLGYKTVTVIALIFTAVLIMLVDLLPWQPASSSRSVHMTSSWVTPDTDPNHWHPRILPKWLRNKRQEDPDLINHIRDNWILRPSDAPRNLEKGSVDDYSQYGQSKFYDRYFNEKQHGFYVEAGAYDGERHSDTLLFEKKRNWNGLLIEADPEAFKRLLKKHRHAYTLNACVSPTNRPMLLNFTSAGIQGGITSLHKLDSPPPGTVTYIQMQCLPLYSVLAAMGNRHVDIMFIDLEGAEYDVIQTLPLRDVNIDVINVEVLMREKDSVKTQRKMDIIQTLVRQYGYKTLDTPFYIDMALSKL